MKTIELIINGQNASFTTKSVTIDGKEYFYSHMTDLHHSPVILTYSFDYDGETKRLTYQKKDTKILMAIFSQVQKMEAQRAAKATAPAQEPVVKAQAPVVKKEVPEVPEVPVESEEAPAADTSESTNDKKEYDDFVTATIALNEQRAKKQAEKEAKKAKKKAIREAKKNGLPIPEDDEKTADTEEATPMDPEKQARLKKSFKIFAIIIAAILVASVVYYFVFGTSNDPSEAGTNHTESQQYEDIDQLIDDLQ